MISERSILPFPTNIRTEMENNQEKIRRLLSEIETAERNGSPVGALCTEATGCLETARQEFLARARRPRSAGTDLRVVATQVQPPHTLTRPAGR